MAKQSNQEGGELVFSKTFRITTINLQLNEITINKEIMIRNVKLGFIVVRLTLAYVHFSSTFNW